MAELETKEPAGGEEEKKANPPSNVSEGIQQFIDKQAAAKEDPPKEEDPPAKDAELSKEGEKEKDKKPTHKAVYFVDEEGNKIPFTMTVDGKLIEVTDSEKLRKYGQLGFHSDTRGKDLNDRELKLKESEDKLKVETAAFTKGQDMLGKIQDAITDGRLSINDSVSAAKAEVPEIDEELYSDPGMLALKKENLTLGKSVKDLMGQVETMNKMFLGKIVEEQHGKLNTEIDQLKPEFGLADEKEVWDLLALQKEDGSPKHTVKEAMALSQENEKGKFDAYVKSDPNFAKLSDEEKETAVKDYLEKKSKREAAPVSSPSSSPAGGDKGTKVDTSKWRMADWAKAGTDMLAKRIADAKKS